MHEVSICQHLLDLLDREAKQNKVTRIVRVRLEVGRLSCLEPEALSFAFAAMAPGTVAEFAELEIDQPPIRATCQDCGATVVVDMRFGSCAACGGVRLELHGGAEMRLLEMEAA